MKTKTKQNKKTQTAATFMPPPQRLQEPDPDKLELFEQIACSRIIVNQADYARRAKPFEQNISARGITFKTENGSFKLTLQPCHNSTIFVLVNLKDKSRLTARLLTDPHALFDFRNHQNFMTATRATFTKFNRTPLRVPCLIIEWKEATSECSGRNREILPQILTAAAFGHINYWWRIARRVQNIILHSPPAGPRPLLNFSSGKTAPAAPGSAQ